MSDGIPNQHGCGKCWREVAGYRGNVGNWRMFVTIRKRVLKGAVGVD
jgi:hypothetical protein